MEDGGGGWLNGALSADPHWAWSAVTSVDSGTLLLSETVVISACHCPSVRLLQQGDRAVDVRAGLSGQGLAVIAARAEGRAEPDDGKESDHRAPETPTSVDRRHPSQLPAESSR
jgi:hypothetical protein